MSIDKINNRRYNGFDHAEPELVGLVDCVDAMSDRAVAVLAMLQRQFTSEEDVLIWSALDSALQEVRDIKATVTSYHESVGSSGEANESAQKSPDK